MNLWMTPYLIASNSLYDLSLSFMDVFIFILSSRVSWKHVGLDFYQISLFRPEMAGCVSKILHQKIIRNSVKIYDILIKWKVLENLSPFVISRKNIELDFGYGPCWPSFCPNRILKEKFLSVLLIFFSELQFYHISYKY